MVFADKTEKTNYNFIVHDILIGLDIKGILRRVVTISIV
jgi:hypothetical protein